MPVFPVLPQPWAPGGAGREPQPGLCCFSQIPQLQFCFPFPVSLRENTEGKVSPDASSVASLQGIFRFPLHSRHRERLGSVSTRPHRRV